MAYQKLNVLAQRDVTDSSVHLIILEGIYNMGIREQPIKQHSTFGRPQTANLLNLFEKYLIL